MTSSPRRPDRLFYFTVIGLTLVGFFIFCSASLGLLGRSGASFNTIAAKQLAVLVVSILSFFVVSKMDYRFWRDYSLYIFIGAALLTLGVFIPGIGLKLNGAMRWVNIGPFTFQPSEFLKLGFILFLAAWLAKTKDGIMSLKRGLVPFLIISGLVGVIMVSQPDIDMLVIMLVGGTAMYFVSGAKWSHLGLLILSLVVAISLVAAAKPYIIARLKTYLNPDQNVLGSSYQINQSLIAIGSGGWAGRGFGQSIQKFKYLPEPIGDSVFSVASEEFGFAGALVIISGFLLFALAGLRIAARAPSGFGRLVTVGIVIMIMTGAFINIASMLGLIPLTGTPLLFVSHGGTALLLALVEAGIIVSVSRHQPKLRS